MQPDEQGPAWGPDHPDHPDHAEDGERPVRTWSLPLRTGVFALMVVVPVAIFFPAAVTPAAGVAAGIYLWLDASSRKRRARHHAASEES